jgi:hypothetical protein
MSPRHGRGSRRKLSGVVALDLRTTPGLPPVACAMTCRSSLSTTKDFEDFARYDGLILLGE